MPPVVTIESVSAAFGLLVVIVALAKSLFAVARFFVELSANVKTLTTAVELLTAELKSHSRQVNALRERVSALESWREEVRT